MSVASRHSKAVLQVCLQLLLTAMALVVLGFNGSTAAHGSEVTVRKFHSKSLGRSIRFTVYRPHQVGESRALPVLYLLHGLNGNEKAWLRLGNIRQTLDKLIATKVLQPLLVIMPMAGNSWYVDDPRPDGYGAVAKALTQDLVSFVDEGFNVGSCRSARAVAGLSMGGLGALQFAFENPDRYAAAISLSGSLFSKGLRLEAQRLRRYISLFAGVYGEPFDRARFNRFNVFAKLEKLQSTAIHPAIWLAAGDNDFPSILRGTVRMHLELRRRNIKSELRVDDAEHTWRYWSKAIIPALKWLSPKLDPVCGSETGSLTAAPKR